MYDHTIHFKLTSRLNKTCKPNTNTNYTVESEKKNPNINNPEVKFIYMNARSLKSSNRKSHNINLLALMNEMCAITETWLNDDISDCELLPDIYRKDRSSTNPVKRGGGVLLAIKRNKKSCGKPELEPDEEVIVCEVEGVKHKKVAKLLLYRPPSSDLACFSRTIENMLVKASKQYERICMLGDFIIPSVNWKSELYSSNITSQSMFCDVINQLSLYLSNCLSMLIVYKQPVFFILH